MRHTQRGDRPIDDAFPVSIHQLIEEQTQRSPDTVALLAPGRKPLTYRRLNRQVVDVVEALNAMGFGHGDRLAVVLPNGPELAVAVLAITATATAAPLNPISTPAELAVHLRDVRARALVVHAGSDPSLTAVAAAHDIPVVELSPDLAEAAGVFTLSGPSGPPAADDRRARSDDVALVLRTSGSTARAKVVPLTHANLCASALYGTAALELTAIDRCLIMAPLFHTQGLVGGALASLAAGASVVCPPGFDALRFFEWLDEFRPTWYTAVPPTHRAILDLAPVLKATIARRPLRFVRASSAFSAPQMLAELEAAFGTPAINSYGLTEVSNATYNPLPPRERKTGSVGVTTGAAIAAMDEAGNLLPPGETGEVVICGPSVMRGYENDPEANRRAFRDNWFRTGDLGYLDADGFLFLTGTLKEVIDRGGEKVAPREVDQVLLDHPAVAQAVTFAVPDDRLGEEVAAAVVLRDHASVTERDLRDFAATRLAYFKVPRRIVVLDELPKGPTGKLQRIGLAQTLGLAVRHERSRNQTGAYVEPRTAIEDAVARIWSEVLGLERVGVEDNFFALGGDSILATQVVARLRQVLQVELSLPSFFAAPTVAGLALASTQDQPQERPMGKPTSELQRRIAGLSPGQRADLEARLLEKSAANASSTVPRRDRALDPTALSPAQQRLWFLQRLDPETTVYNLGRRIRLRGRLDVRALEASLQEIVRRHEILRTTFVEVTGRPVQVVHDDIGFSMDVLDVDGTSPDEQETWIWAQAWEAKRPFDLERGPLLRARLLRLGPEEHILLLTLHHLVTDAWSNGVLFRELAALYAAFSAGQSSPLPDLSIQYADYAVWQRQRLEGTGLEEQLAYWRQRLAGVAPLELPTDFPRPAVHIFRGARERRTLAPALTAGMKEVGRQEGATAFMTLLAIWQTLLARYAGQDDFVVGTPIAGRTRVETEPLIGFFVNTLALRADMSGDPPFRTVLKRAREAALAAYAHQEVPFERLVEVLQPERDLSRPPIVQVFLNMRNVAQAPLALSGLTLEAIPSHEDAAMFDMTLYVAERDGGIELDLVYNADLFEQATATQLLTHVETLVEGIVANPEERLSRIPLPIAVAASDPAAKLRSRRAHGTFVPFPKSAIEQTLARRFGQQVEANPHALAVRSARVEWTYRELDRVANGVAQAIRAKIDDRTARVALLLDHDVPMVAAVLGVLKAGHAYVPIDPFFPAARMEFLLRDTQASVLITQGAHLARARTVAPGGLPMIDLDDLERGAPDGAGGDVPPSALAYILYTSGSTGQPKGVMQSHRNVLAHVRTYTNNLGIGVGDRLSLLPSYGTDAAVQDIFGALLNGASLHLFDLRGEGVDAIGPWLRAEEITLYHSTPTVFRHVAASLSDETFPHLRLVVLGGEEAVKRDFALFRHHFSPECVFVNGLGPTESTLALQYFADSGAELSRNSVPVGYPVEGTDVLFLDRAGREIAGYGVGEIAIRGEHVALGYWRRPELTAAAFLADATGGDRRLYRTGDLGRPLPDGSFEFLGRADAQVKIRGYRVEPGEIEAVLERHPAVAEAVVVARDDIADDLRLVAYVRTEAPVPTSGALRDFVKSHVPDYMVPTAVVFMDTLPLTSSGKIDRRALPPPNMGLPRSDAVFVAPRSPTEEAIAGIWAEVLGVARVGVEEDFFDLGGHSLLATQVISRVRDAFGVELPLRRLFETPTVAGLALTITEQQAEAVDAGELASLLAELEAAT